MITLDKVRHEIHELLEKGCMSEDCVRDLTMLYWLKEQMERDTHGSEYEHKSEYKAPKLDRKKAEQWVRYMKNSDGSTGEHWSYDQVYQLMKLRGVEGDPVAVYATMNMLWSDYGKVAERHNVSTPDFWVEMTKAFLKDEDAVDDKLWVYYDCIVKH